MVQVLLKRELRQSLGAGLILASVALLPAPIWASPKSKPQAAPVKWEMLLEGGRRLSWERSFDSESQVKPDRGFWNKVIDFVAGAPDFRSMVRPYSVAIDSRGRIIVTDPGAAGRAHFRFRAAKYKFIERLDASKDPMLTPQCVAVDAAGQHLRHRLGDGNDLRLRSERKVSRVRSAA